MFDFYRVAAICPKVMVADASYNVDEILKKLEDAYQENVAVIAFPELAVTGYSCQDLFFQQALIRAAGEGLSRILSATSGHESAVIVGAPALVLGQLYNAAYVMLDGKLIACPEWLGWTLYGCAVAGMLGISLRTVRKADFAEQGKDETGK